MLLFYKQPSPLRGLHPSFFSSLSCCCVVACVFTAKKTNKSIYDSGGVMVWLFLLVGLLWCGVGLVVDLVGGDDDDDDADVRF